MGNDADEHVRRFREDGERALAMQFAAYRGGAKAAFDSMMPSTSSAAKHAGNAWQKCSGVIGRRNTLRRT